MNSLGTLHILILEVVVDYSTVSEGVLHCITHFNAMSHTEHSGHCMIRMGTVSRDCYHDSLSDFHNFEYLPRSFSWSDDRKELYRPYLLTEEAIKSKKISNKSICDLMVKLDTDKEVQIDLLAATFSNIIIDAATSSVKFKFFKPKKK